MYKKILFVTVVYWLAVSVVKSNDLRLVDSNGHRYSRKIYSEIKEANPALWKRTDEVTVNTTGNEYITGVFVSDLRDDKDGESYIVSGGLGQRSVTIGLKSPTIFRGYRFLIEVYATSSSNNQGYYAKGAYYDNSQYARKY